MTMKNMTFPGSIKQRLKREAFESDTTMGEIVRDVIVGYANGEVASPPPTIREPMIEVKFEAPPEYDKAMERARQDGVTLSDVVRQELSRRLAESESVAA